MIELHERIYHENGKHEDFIKKYSSKALVIKLLKKSPMPNEFIYELKRENEAKILFQGKKRRFQLVEVID